MSVLDIGAVWQPPSEPPPDPPPPNNPLPAIITAGGTYSGSATGVVQVRTAAPVTIENSVITNTTTPVAGNRQPAYLLQAEFAGVNLTVRNTVFNGGYGQAIVATGYSNLFIDRCTVNGTWGMRLNNCQAGADVRITQCKFVNQQRHAPTDGNGWGWSHSIQFADSLQNHDTITVDWNQFENRYGESWCEDIISFFRTGKGWVHDNGIRGAYPPVGYGSSYSGGGIMAGDNGGGNTLVENNHVVGTMNYLYAILGGGNSTIRNNRGVNDSRTDAGVAIAQSSGGLGIQIWNLSNAAGFVNNVAYDNAIGVIKADGTSNNYWLGTPGNGNSITNVTPITPVNLAQENAEWQIWLNKVAASGKQIGAV